MGGGVEEGACGYRMQWAVLSCGKALGRRRGAVGSDDNNPSAQRPNDSSAQQNGSGGVEEWVTEWRSVQWGGPGLGGPWAVQGQ